MKITNSITNSIYGKNVVETEPKRKHVYTKSVPKTLGVLGQVLAQEVKDERQALIDENERLHRLQQMRRK
jgi:hypothetical protein